MSVSVHIDQQIGLTMQGVHVEEINNGHGQHYWKATAAIGSIFGHPVHGNCEGIGPTREVALERLAEDQKKLADSLWA